MADVKCIAPTRIGGTDIEYAQGMRAGSWLFFTGHMATDFEHGLAAMVAGKPGLPLGSPAVMPTRWPRLHHPSSTTRRAASAMSASVTSWRRIEAAFTPHMSPQRRTVSRPGDSA